MKRKREFVTVYIMGKGYRVPADCTIMGALEYAGYQLIRGVGCREGFCGACATVFRIPGDYKLHGGLSCSTLVQDGMYLALIPSVPRNKAVYALDELEPTVATFHRYFPETFRCVACNTCTKACPQDLEVMDYIQAVKQGNLARAADLSFDCLSCGLCAIRCPAEMVQHDIGLLARRLFGKYLNPKSKHLEERIEEVHQGRFDAELAVLKKMDRDGLQERYYGREVGD